MHSISLNGIKRWYLVKPPLRDLSPVIAFPVWIPDIEPSNRYLVGYTEDSQVLIENLLNTGLSSAVSVAVFSSKKEAEKCAEETGKPIYKGFLWHTDRPLWLVVKFSTDAI